MRGDPPSTASRGGAEPRGHADRKPFPMNRIHCLSTVDLDRIFEIDHLPAHDEKIFATAFREVAGGQGVFTARALAALGAPVTFIGTVGDDAAGDFVVASLQRVEGLDVAIEPDLRERSYGEFAGRPYADARPGRAGRRSQPN